MSEGPLLYLPDHARREELSGFVARVVLLDAEAVVRLRAADGEVVAWATTPFDVLATRSVPGELRPADLTVAGHDLLAALAVARDDRVDPGTPVDARWRAELPPPATWRDAGEVASGELEALADKGIALANEQGGTSPELLDDTAFTAGDGVRVPMRCVLAMSGLGLLAGTPARVFSTDAWLRLDSPNGAVARRRRAPLRLVF